MTYRTLRRLLLIGCFLGAVASWWFSCVVHTSLIVSTPVFSVYGTAHAGGLSLVRPPEYPSPWRFDFSRWPVRQVVWYGPAGRFQAGRRLSDGDWYLGVPLWFPWFLLGGGAWLLLRRAERRAMTGVEIAGQSAAKKPDPA